MEKNTNTKHVPLDSVLDIINSLPTLHNTTEGGRMFVAWDRAVKEISALPSIEIAEKNETVIYSTEEMGGINRRASK